MKEKIKLKKSFFLNRKFSMGTAVFSSISIHTYCVCPSTDFLSLDNVVKVDKVSLPKVANGNFILFVLKNF